MDESGWPEERWVALGERIAASRRTLGWDQQELAQRSGNSANTISNYERGRAPKSRRIPGGIKRVEYALGWPEGTAFKVLNGQAGEAPPGISVPLGVAESTESAAPIRLSPGLQDEPELVESGHLAQDLFVRQAKRYRELHEISAEELARRVGELGVDLSTRDVEGLENGTRLLRMAEAKAIAVALNVTVEWLLGSSFSADAPEEMKGPPSDKELQAEAKALERRMGDLGSQVLSARTQYERAREREEEARQQAEMSMVIYQQVNAMQREMERQYQYLLGRIDSLRAASGDELIMQSRLVYEDDGTPSGSASVGAALRRARKAAGLTVADVAASTKVRPQILEAIEAGDFTRCGPPDRRHVYARGHIRTLARAVGLDPQPLLDAYDGANAVKRPEPTAPEPPSTRARSHAKPRRVILRNKKSAGDQ